MKSLRPKLKRELDKLIKKWHLHAAWDEPVVLDPAIERYRAGYRHLGGRRDAVTYHWRANDQEYYRIVYDWSMRETKASHDYRHIGGHEAGHVFGNHQGVQFGARRGRFYTVGLDRRLEDYQESECELVAAYLLVSLKALQMWACYDAPFIARKLDVPVHLVTLRREMMSEQSVRDLEAQHALFAWPDGHS